MEGAGHVIEARSRPRPAHPHWARDWGVAVALGILALVAFAAIGNAVLERRTFAIDTAVRAWVLAHRSGPVTALFTVITTLGSVTPMVVYSVIGAFALSRRARPLVASTVLVAPATAVVAYLGLKRVFARLRPSGIGNVIEGTWSFPSAHATTAAAICCTIAYVAWREGLVPGAVALVAAALVPLLVGASRVYLDAHWTTDILGGWSAGVCIAALSAVLYEVTCRIHARRQPSGERS